jgi:accessory secretory protein Asp1
LCAPAGSDNGLGWLGDSLFAFLPWLFFIGNRVLKTLNRGEVIFLILSLVGLSLCSFISVRNDMHMLGIALLVGLLIAIWCIPSLKIGRNMLQKEMKGGVESDSIVIGYFNVALIAAVLTIYAENNMSFERVSPKRITCQYKINQLKYIRSSPECCQYVDEVMKEYLQMKLHHFSFDDIVVIASDEHHNEMLMQSIWKQKIILSLFGDRFDIHKGGHVYHKADIVLTDSDEKKHIIEEEFRVHNVYTVSPFDTRFQLGQSQRTKKHKIYFPIDDIQIELKALEDIIEYMKSHPLVELYIGLYQFDHTFENTIYEIMNQLLRKCNAKMNIEVGIKKESSRIHLVPIMSENDLISLFVDMRLIVDLREHPDTFTLIAGMSTGIPQIVKHENNYIHHKKNGLYLERGISLQESIRYYLEYLEHWNDSLVYSYSLMQEYTGEKILKKWKEMIKNESKY